MSAIDTTLENKFDRILDHLQSIRTAISNLQEDVKTDISNLQDDVKKMTKQQKTRLSDESELTNDELPTTDANTTADLWASRSSAGILGEFLVQAQTDPIDTEKTIILPWQQQDQHPQHQQHQQQDLSAILKSTSDTNTDSSKSAGTGVTPLDPFKTIVEVTPGMAIPPRAEGNEGEGGEGGEGAFSPSLTDHSDPPPQSGKSSRKRDAIEIS
jgi:hypothetical protein